MRASLHDRAPNTY